MSETPKQITEEIRTFAKEEIGSDFEPIFMEIKAAEGTRPQKCHENVADAIAKLGGSIQYGWSVWEGQSLWLEAEFHSVWVTPNGEWVDITPDPDGETQRLFVPDNRFKYEGAAFARKYRTTTSDPKDRPRVDKFIEINREIDSIMVKYKAGVPLSPEDNSRVLKLRGDAHYALIGSATAVPIFGPVISGQLPVGRIPIARVGRNEPCPCGSGRKFKNCCIRFA